MLTKAVCACWLVTADTRKAVDIVADAVTQPPHDPQKYSHAMSLKQADVLYLDRFLLCGFRHKDLNSDLGSHGTGYVYIKEEQPTCPACLFMLKHTVTDMKDIL